MALFFDQAWFDAQLTRMGTSRADIARLLSLNAVQVEELWKDQRELSARDVALLARFLNVSPLTVAERAGVSTPVPAAETSAGPAVQALAALSAWDPRCVPSCPRICETKLAA